MFGIGGRSLPHSFPLFTPFLLLCFSFSYYYSSSFLPLSSDCSRSMASDKGRIHKNNLSRDADNVNSEGTMHSTRKSKSAMGSGTFQIFVECEDGINLYVDLNSSPSDCLINLGLPQNLHKRKCRRRSSVEMGANFPPATAQGAFLKNGLDEFYGSTKGQESLYINSSKSCLPVLSQPSRAMEELSVQSGAWENGAMREKEQPGKEGIDQSSLSCMRARESELRNFEMGNQVAPGICQQGPGNEGAVQNQGREIQRSLGNSQGEPQRYISKYKKSPIVKNFRFLKTLARGPLVQASAVERRRSTRLVDKSP